MRPTSIGVIGYGAFGAFVCTLLARFAPEVRVLVSSRTRPEDGKTFVSFEEACRADAIIFAVPIHAFEETLARALPHIGREAVIIPGHFLF